MRSRNGISLIETLVVLAIIGVMLGLLLPVVQTTRMRALEIVCKNNLRQINLAVASYYEAQRRLPPPAAPGFVGGWTIEVLPFIEQQNLRDQISPRTPIATAPKFLLRQPTIMTCPVSGHSATATGMDRASYLLHQNGKAYSLFDAPVDANFPWANGPEMDATIAFQQPGPHNGGFFYSGGFNDGVVTFVPSQH